MKKKSITKIIVRKYWSKSNHLDDNPILASNCYLYLTRWFNSSFSIYLLDFENDTKKEEKNENYQHSCQKCCICSRNFPEFPIGDIGKFAIIFHLYGGNFHNLKEIAQIRKSVVKRNDLWQQTSLIYGKISRKIRLG